LRAYQAFHPDAAIYTVTYRGRTVWMTSKQQAIWHEIQKYWHRGKRDTLRRIADVVGCSRATVSRFLRRLDLWRFIDLATIRGRTGGTWVFTRKDPYNETPRRWTMSLRAAYRARLAERIREAARQSLEPLLQAYRKANPRRAIEPRQGTFLTGSTDATYWIPIDYHRRPNVDTYGRKR
jgi:DNA-binding MurR/RpiR family transcriptional regulator